MLPQKVLKLSDALKKKKPKLQGTYLATLKVDGWFCYIDYICGRGWSDIHSSAGRVIPSLQQYKHQFVTLPEPKEDCRLIAEVTVPGLVFKEINGILNRSVGNCHAEGVIFFLHDYIPLRTYMLDIEKNRALARYNKLSFDLRPHLQGKNIYVLDILGAGTYESGLWQRWFEEQTEKGEEGIVLRRDSGLYSPGKCNADVIKMKVENVYDLLCKRTFWTTGEKGNEAFNLELERANGTIVNIVVAKHSEINKLQETSPVGKVVAIKAMGELESGSLRQPVYKCVRWDKTSLEID